MDCILLFLEGGSESQMALLFVKHHLAWCFQEWFYFFGFLSESQIFSNVSKEIIFSSF